MYGFVAILIAVIAGVGVVNSVAPESKTRALIGMGLVYGFLVVALMVMAAYYRWHNRQEILIGVTSDGLTVNKRRGYVFALSDLTLGPWGWGAGTMGTALHLRCGRSRFVLGGRDHRVGSGTRLSEAPVPGVDAWLGAAEFDQLLAMVGPNSGLDLRPPTPGAPTRCVLFPNPQRVQADSPSAVRKRHRSLQSASSLAIDVSADAIRLIDSNTNALIASASPAEVSATPATYQIPYRHWYRSPNNLMTDLEMKYLSTAPELILHLPGTQPLTVACLDTQGALGVTRRFSWRGDTPTANEPADYAVSGADWLMLVDKLGLAPYQETSSANLSSPIPTPAYIQNQPVPSSQRRRNWGTIVVGLVVSVVVIASGAYPMWIQNFGAPDRITVQFCDKALQNFTDLLFYGSYHCTGKSHQQGQVDFWGMYQNNAGQDIDVHVAHGGGDSGDAVPDAWIIPPILVAVGSALGVVMVIAFVRRLRRPKI
jgi:hypothetical protein